MPPEIHTKRDRTILEVAHSAASIEVDTFRPMLKGIFRISQNGGRNAPHQKDSRRDNGLWAPLVIEWG